MNQTGPLIASPSLSNPSEAAKRLLPWLVAVAFFMSRWIQRFSIRPFLPSLQLSASHPSA